jgi:hypothetical protein
MVSHLHDLLAPWLLSNLDLHRRIYDVREPVHWMSVLDELEHRLVQQRVPLPPLTEAVDVRAALEELQRSSCEGGGGGEKQKQQQQQKEQFSAKIEHRKQRKEGTNIDEQQQLLNLFDEQ